MTPRIPRKSLCGSLFCVLSQEMRHINFFLGGPKWGVLGEGQKVYVEIVYVFFSVPYRISYYRLFKFRRVSETPTPIGLEESMAVHLRFVRQYPPPICIAGPSWLLSLEERETQQYTSHLYCSTPPICTAVRLPFVRQHFGENTGDWGHRKVPDKLSVRKVCSEDLTKTRGTSSKLCRTKQARKNNYTNPLEKLIRIVVQVHGKGLFLMGLWHVSLALPLSLSLSLSHALSVFSSSGWKQMKPRELDLGPAANR